MNYFIKIYYSKVLLIINQIMKNYGICIIPKKGEEEKAKAIENVVIPLLSRTIKTTMNDYSTIVTESLLYCNKKDEEVEAEFRFPSKNYSLFNVSYQIGSEAPIIMKVEDKDTAQKKYDDALSQGNQAFLASNVENKIYSIKIGRLRKDEPVTLQFSYYSEIDISEKSLNFRVPITLIPPYVSLEELPEFDPKKLPLFSFKGLSYGIHFSANIERSDGFDISIYGLDRAVKQLSSTNNENKHSIVIPETQIDGSRDISLRIVPNNPIKSNCQFYTDYNGEQYLQTTFCNYEPKELAEPDKEKVKRFVFIIDGSGSMHGESIKHAKQAAKLALQELPNGCQFTLAMFGSNYRFFEEAQWLDYDEKSRNEGHAWLKKYCNANYGGTEMFQVLDEGYKRLIEKDGDNYDNYVILITDGAVNNQEPIYELINKYNKLVNIYTLGIGNGHDSTFLDKCTSLGNGVSKHVYNNEEIEESIQFLLKAILKPTIRDIRLEFANCESDDGLPYTKDVLFFNEPWTTYSKIKNVIGEPKVRLVCNWSMDRTLIDETTPSSSVSTRSTVALPEITSRSFATCKIKQIMDNKELNDNQKKNLVLPLALKYDIVTKWTSAVAMRILEQKDGEPAKLEKVDIPISKPAEFGEFDVLECASVNSYPKSMMAMCAMPMSRSVSESYSNKKRSFSMQSFGALPTQEEDDENDDNENPRTAKDIIDDIIFTQKINGCWDLEKVKDLIEFAKIKDDPHVQTLIRETSENVGTTLLVLGFFWKYSEFRTRWLRSFEKAEEYLFNEDPSIEIENKAIELSVLF